MHRPRAHERDKGEDSRLQANERAAEETYPADPVTAQSSRPRTVRKQVSAVHTAGSHGVCPSSPHTLTEHRGAEVPSGVTREDSEVGL